MRANPEILSLKRPRVPQLSLERLYRTRTIGAGRWSPDGKWVAFIANTSSRQNIWVVPSAGGWPLQLTVSDQRQILGQWSPDGKWIVFQSDHDGDEQWDLFTVSLEDGEVRNLTRTPEISEETPRWSPDGKYLAYASKPKIAASYEIHVMDFASGTVREITRNTPPEFSNEDPLWSKDGRYLAYTRTRADQKLDQIFIADLSTGESRDVTPPGGEHNYYADDWSPDGRRLLITSSALNRSSNVALLDIAASTVEWITRDVWETEGGEFDPSGRTLVYERNVEGNTEVSLYDLASRTHTPLAQRAGLNAVGSEVFDRAGRRALVSHAGPCEPNDLYTFDLRTGADTRLTNSLLAAMQPEDLVEPYLVHYSSRDGLEISAFVYVPYNLERNARNPAVVYVHGGPSAQSMNGFNRSIQFLVNNGYVVIA